MAKLIIFSFWSVLQLIATAALFLTAKSEEAPRPLNNILRTSSEILHKQDFALLSYRFPVVSIVHTTWNLFFFIITCRRHANQIIASINLHMDMSGIPIKLPMHLFADSQSNFRLVLFSNRILTRISKIFSWYILFLPHSWILIKLWF